MIDTQTFRFNLKQIAAHVDHAKTTSSDPQLLFVHDQGWYLMSNGDYASRPPVVYAAGSGPNDGGYGDDFAEPLPIADFEAALAGGGTSLTIKVKDLGLDEGISFQLGYTQIIRPEDVTPRIRAEAMFKGAAAKARKCPGGCRFTIQDRPWLLRFMGGQTYSIAPLSSAERPQHGSRKQIITIMERLYQDGSPAPHSTPTAPPSSAAQPARRPRQGTTPLVPLKK